MHCNRFFAMVEEFSSGIGKKSFSRSLQLEHVQVHKHIVISLSSVDSEMKRPLSLRSVSAGILLLKRLLCFDAFAFAAAELVILLVVAFLNLELLCNDVAVEIDLLGSGFS